MASRGNPSNLERLEFALALHRSGDIAAAARIYRELIAADPRDFNALHFLGVIDLQQGRLAEAERLITQAIKINPGSGEAHFNLGHVFLQAGRNEQALAAFEACIRLNPRHEAALVTCGLLQERMGRLEAALASFSGAVALNRANAEALTNSGVILHRLKRYDEALASYERALAVRPDLSAALHNRGLTLHALGRFDQALTSYDRALALQPENADVLINRGATLHALGHSDRALADYDRALAARPDHVDALRNRAAILQGQGRGGEALACYDKALAADASRAEIWLDRGVLLDSLQRYDEALSSYDRALALKPDHADALNSRGVTLFALKRLDEALANYDRAIALRPDFAIALNNRGGALMTAGQYREAAADFRRVLQIDPDFKAALGNFVHTRMHICDWAGLDDAVAQVASAVRAGKYVAEPFQLLAADVMPQDQLACARIYLANRLPPRPPPLWRGERYRHDRIRLAYISADFREHATMIVMAELFERHDRSRFETVAISLNPEEPSPMRERARAAFEHFITVDQKSDAEVAALLREMEIDIAVDLKGHTRDNRIGIFARRPAPIQASYMGFPGSTGADFIDYVLADPVVLPFDQQANYSERIVHLPDCYWVNDSKRAMAPSVPTRRDAGLPDQGFVFCCFNASYKITPPLFDIWMRLLRRIEGSVLWLLAVEEVVAANLRREAAARGIDPQRLIFAPRAGFADHLARHKLADLFLDTLPYNAHTTATDALWTEVPLVTCPGTAFCSRVAASLLRALDLPELIAPTLEEYEALAARLAEDPALLGQVRQKLARNRLTQPLFDTDRFRRHMEAAYTTMWETWQRGEPPRSFAVDRL